MPSRLRPVLSTPFALACLVAAQLGALAPDPARAQAPGPVVAAPAAAGTSMAPPMPAVGAPVGHVVRGATGATAFQNGGIGDEEVADLDAHADRYNVRLTFSEGTSNAYAANLKLRVSSAAGAPVFALDDAGPLTDLSLPPGRYRVAAWYGEAERGGVLDVGRHGRATLNLHWNHEHPTDVAP